jgi:uncharacterized protein (DUF924 family)
MAKIKPITSPRDVLDFWFGGPEGADFGSPRPEWFSKSDDFDGAILERFGDAVETALNGGFEEWSRDFDGALARIILLDQFPRNIFRGSAKMYAGDLRARTVAGLALEFAIDTPPSAVQRLFLYLPFEHSEDLQDQEYSVSLFEAMPNVAEKERWLDYAIRHRDIVARFDRFPHRNKILGRPSTPEELEFLAQPDSGF